MYYNKGFSTDFLSALLTFFSVSVVNLANPDTNANVCLHFVV